MSYSIDCLHVYIVQMYLDHQRLSIRKEKLSVLLDTANHTWFSIIGVCRGCLSFTQSASKCCKSDVPLTYAKPT